MRVAVTSTVIFDVPDGDVDTVKRHFEAANRYAIDRPMETVGGQVYVLRAIERLEVKLRVERL
jgi:hypothetical protein